MTDQYGLSDEDFAAILSAQGGRCATCKRRFTSRLRPQRDHSHRTGNFRGLLCLRCNRLLGYVHEDGELLFALSQYLDRPPADAIFDQPRRHKDAPPIEYVTPKEN